MSDIVERLAHANEYEPLGYVGWEAADEILRLRAEVATLRAAQEQLGLFLVEINGRGYYVPEPVLREIEKLRAALKPFAYYASQIPDDVSDTASASGTVCDLRAAAAAIREGKND